MSANTGHKPGTQVLTGKLTEHELLLRGHFWISPKPCGRPEEPVKWKKALKKFKSNSCRSRVMTE